MNIKSIPNPTFNMIAIAFINHRNCEGLIMKMFSMEVEAREWLIDILLINDNLRSWGDEDGDYWTPEEIKVALQKCTLAEIVEGARDGAFEIDMVSSD